MFFLIQLTVYLLNGKAGSVDGGGGMRVLSGVARFPVHGFDIGS